MVTGSSHRTEVLVAKYHLIICLLSVHMDGKALIWQEKPIWLKHEYVRKVMCGLRLRCWVDLGFSGLVFDVWSVGYPVFKCNFNSVFFQISGRRVGPLRVPLLRSLVNSDLLRVLFIYKLQENGSTTKPTSKNSKFNPIGQSFHKLEWEWDGTWRVRKLRKGGWQLGADTESAW